MDCHPHLPVGFVDNAMPGTSQIASDLRRLRALSCAGQFSAPEFATSGSLDHPGCQAGFKG